ncbi:MAG: thiamine phosphate synthase [Odoribacteraceae bacterium]|jgi:thiamine-phosphate pyrophosphorylase|nr:thiamine phosphate synthase [Odoribacteraceae bacterium]
MIIVITSPGPVDGEGAACNALFEQGLQVLHLRKPGAAREVLEAFIREILPAYRHRIVVHDHFELVDRFGLKGVHANARRASDKELSRFANVSLSCHSLEEVEATASLPWRPSYLFLGPLFDSISKPGYAAARFDEQRSREVLARHRVIALGGVTASNLPRCRATGFAGGALLGHLWEQPREVVDRFARLPPPPVLAIAGLDPTSGAGLSSDIKTIESCKALGLGACSAITFQNQHAYRGAAWSSPREIIRQCEVLLEEFTPAVVKIGLVESPAALLEITTYLRERLPAARVIWDPILTTSSGHSFREQVEHLDEILEKIDLVTPNANEARQLFGDDREASLLSTCRARNVAILRKGGHDDGEQVTDLLLLPGGQVHAYSIPRAPGGKHGTGCILSASIAALLARGYSLPEACQEGQRHVDRFIRSNPTPLGRHDVPAPRSLSSIPLQYITHPRDGVTMAEQVEAACQGGARWIQFRAKAGSVEEILLEGAAVRQVCREHGALFIVNDRVEVARALDADGVHLGQEDMSPARARRLLGCHKIIGATCNTITDVAESARQGVDYIGLGPFAHTGTKERLAPVLGLDGYRRVIAAARSAGVTTPVHAIGGIRLEDVEPLARTGVNGIAVSSLINHSTNPRAMTRQILDKLCYK